jgi:hypothetical protein
MFAKRDILMEYLFDEQMGCGTIFGSQEGYDIVYRMLLDNKKLSYSPEIVFYHPKKIATRTTQAEIKRAFYYSCGFGYLCRKHGFTGKYRNRMLKLCIILPIVFIVKNSNYKYFKMQKIGLFLGYKYLM